MALTISGFNMTGNLTAVHVPLPPVVPSGYLWTTGQGVYGGLGLGNTTSYSSPKQVGSSSDWAIVSAGLRNGAAIKTDGTLWMWGYNIYGYLGLGDTNNRSSPTQVGSLTSWLKISAGYNVKAIKTDGTLWTWGNGNAGRLGLGDTVQRSSPTQIGSLTTWASISNSNNGSTNFAIKTDGTLWGWGKNNAGQLGTGDTVDRSSPVQVGALTTWLQISAGYYHAVAVKTDGTSWAWGKNNAGQLGLGNTTDISSPVQIGSLTNWSSVSAGRQGFSCAVKTDGTAWSWGANSYGRLGHGNTTNRSSPVQIGALTNWLQLTAANYHISSIKTDGTLWTWGRNSAGGLGLGNTTYYSSPKQVGSLTNWLAVSAGYDLTFGIA